MLQDRDLVGWCFSTLGSYVVALHQLMGGKVLHMDWWFGGERFFIDVSGPGKDGKIGYVFCEWVACGGHDGGGQVWGV